MMRDDSGKSAKSRRAGKGTEFEGHVNTIHEFIDKFCSLPEVKASITQKEDIYGVNDALSYYMDNIFAQAKNHVLFSKLQTDEQRQIFEEIEKYIARRIYPK